MYYPSGEKESMKMLSLRLPKKVKDKLEIAATNKGITQSQYVRILIVKALKLRLKDIKL